MIGHSPARWLKFQLVVDRASPKCAEADAEGLIEAGDAQPPAAAMIMMIDERACGRGITVGWWNHAGLQLHVVSADGSALPQKRPGPLAPAPSVAQLMRDRVCVAQK